MMMSCFGGGGGGLFLGGGGCFGGVCPRLWLKIRKTLTPLLVARREGGWGVGVYGAPNLIAECVVIPCG